MATVQMDNGGGPVHGWTVVLELRAEVDGTGTSADAAVAAVRPVREALKTDGIKDDYQFVGLDIHRVT